MRTRRRSGFSLLEVMVALAIFGLMVTGIMAAHGALVASNRRAANMGLATTFARCKMAEVEEILLRKGYPDLDVNETDGKCCEDYEPSNNAPKFQCDYKIDKVILPSPPTSTDADGGGGLFGAASASASAGVPPELNLDGGIAGIGQQLGMPAGGGVQGMLGTVMALVYPSLKPVLEASIRKLTIVVRWKDGSKPEEFSLVQYVTNPQKAGLISGVLPVAPGVAGTGATGGAGATGATGATGAGTSTGKSP